MPRKQVIAATDGSSLGNPGPAGWAWYIDEDTWAAGGMQSATNQQAELFAVLAVLRAVPKDRPLLICTDSQYTLKTCTLWIPAWKSRGWRRSDFGPVANLDLVKELDRALNDREAPVEFQWVRGHAGDALNEHADFRCTEASAAVRKKEKVTSGPGWSNGPSGRTAAVPKKAPRKSAQAKQATKRPTSTMPTGPRMSLQPPKRTSRPAANRPVKKLSGTPKAPRKLPRPDLVAPKEGALCNSCGAPINPYSLECRCSR